MTYINVYPLLPYIWNSANTRLRMEFLLPPDTLPMQRPSQIFQISNTNEILAALSSAKAEHSRAYGRSPRLVSSIFIYTNQSGGFIKLNMSQNSVPNASRNAYFDITAEDDCTLEQPLESSIVKFFKNRRPMSYFLRTRIVSSDEIGVQGPWKGLRIVGNRSNDG